MAEDFTHSAHFRFRDGCCSLMTTMIVFKCNLEKIVKNAKFANLLISLCAFDVKCNFFILSTTSRLFFFYKSYLLKFQGDFSEKYLQEMTYYGIETLRSLWYVFLIFYQTKTAWSETCCLSLAFFVAMAVQK